ncbi:MAG TPA: class I SAM-dependent methyltransferase [Methanomassiliicoccales archaeon]|nr:class I SAM-dependent methyltransferase [Methanomassiliicoccales archaeon]
MDYLESSWCRRGFSDLFVETADVAVPDRRRLISLAQDLYMHFIFGRQGCRVLDLGCGDGTYGLALRQIDPDMKLTLLDGSEEMLDKARARTNDWSGVEFVRTSFESLIEKDLDLGKFDMVISSLAIHHLPLDGKKRLFSYIHEHLYRDGFLLNIDTMLPPTLALEDFYIQRWEAQIMDLKSRTGVDFDHPELIYGHHQEPRHHALLSTLKDQLDALEDIGYIDVDVLFKNGIFTAYCGRKL